MLVILEFLEHHSKAKRTKAPAYSRALNVGLTYHTITAAPV